MTTTSLAPALEWHRPSLPFAAQLGAVLLLVIALAALGPSTFAGGSADDYRYLQGLRCLAEQGYCAPRNHWEARLPLTAPAALLSATFGESRFVLGLVPLAYALGVLALLATIVRRFWGERAALVAVLVLATTPLFVRRSVQLNVDIPELFFLLAGAFLLLKGVERDRVMPVIAAGALFGLAVLSRTTALAMAPIVAAGLFLFKAQPLRWCAWLAAGTGAMLAAEALLHAIGAGEPLLSWRLAHAHTQIATSALPPGFDLSRSPILNPDFIAAWQRPGPIRLYGLLDGGLNLFFDPHVRLPLSAGLLVGLAHLYKSRSSTGIYLAGAAALYFVILTYVLAVHPTGRMFLPILCLAACAIGVGADRYRSPRAQAIVAALLLAMLVQGATVASQSLDPAPYEVEAERWVRSHNGGLSIDRTTARIFNLSPVISALPAADAAIQQPVLSLNRPCIERARDAPSTLLRSWTHKPEPGLVSTVRAQLGIARPQLMLCIYRR